MVSDLAPNKPFFEALLATDNILWPLILRYNAHPYSVLDKKEKCLLPDLSMERLNVWLAQSPDRNRFNSLNEKAVFFWDFSEDSRKLALLNDVTLSRLASVAGVTLHAQEIAHLVESHARKKCREALCEDLFDYALTRGQYQTGAAGKIMAQRDTDLSLPSRCRKHGWLTLCLCALHWPDVLKQPFQLRLQKLANSKNISINAEDVVPLEETDWQALWRMLKKCLLREVLPSWTPYFTA